MSQRLAQNVHMTARASSVAFAVAILVWPGYALGWIPGGLPATAITSGFCFTASFLCYRVLRVRHDADQIAQLRAMQERDSLSDEELLSHVARHHPNLDRFAKTLAANADAGKREEQLEEQPDELVTLFPWIAWSETDTAKTRQKVVTVFDKEPSALDSNEAGLLLGMLEAGSKDKRGMFMIVAKPIADGLEQAGFVSMDPAQRDAYGRQRLPEIAREIGLAEDVIDELGWGWSKRHWERE